MIAHRDRGKSFKLSIPDLNLAATSLCSDSHQQKIIRLWTYLPDWGLPRTSSNIVSYSDSLRRGSGWGAALQLTAWLFILSGNLKKKNTGRRDHPFKTLPTTREHNAFYASLAPSAIKFQHGKLGTAITKHETPIQQHTAPHKTGHCRRCGFQSQDRLSPKSLVCPDNSGDSGRNSSRANSFSTRARGNNIRRMQNDQSLHATLKVVRK